VDDDGPGNHGDNDDVSLNVRFTVNVASNATFPDQSGRSFSDDERYNYTLEIYNSIPNDAVGIQLLNADFAQIKQVSSGHDFSGWANSGNQTMILTQSANSRTAVHEWGHLCGLPDVYGDQNSRRIMYGIRNATKNEINTTERAAMLSY
jgi:hypothetical protein